MRGIIGGTIIIIIGIGVTTPTVLATTMITTGTRIVGLMDMSATAESILTTITGTEDIGMIDLRESRRERYALVLLSALTF